MQKPEDSDYLLAERLVRELQGAGHRALLAGGCVRDMLRGERPSDYDIATDASPEQVKALFVEVNEVGKQFGVCRVRADGLWFEVATFRREWGYSDGRHPDGVAFCGPEEDAARRDFTVNAMFYDPVRDDLLDHFGGVADLRAGILRAVGDAEERFREDHLRLLRAVRFAARLEFRIEARTREAIRSLAHTVANVAPERLQQELRIILTDRAPADPLRLMDDLGMLCVIFPEFSDMKGCEQPANYHPEGDVFVHTILTVEKLGPHPDFETAMAALLHDVGKPEASKESEEMAFPEHSRIGSEMARSICERLRISNAETDRICWLVDRHLYFKDAPNMRESTLKKLFAEPGFEQLAAIHRADALASWGNLETYNYVMKRREEMPEEEAKPPRLVTGYDLIEMGYEPGPMFSDVLEQVRDAQLEGNVADRPDARRLARRLAEEHSKSS